MDLAGYFVTAVAAYFVGSIPFGFIVAKARGVDIRSVGSGNIGATNVLRILGKPAGIFVLFLDGLKGYTAAAWMADALASVFHYEGTPREWVGIVAGISAVLGHNYTCWLRFRGGKGIATSAGVLAALVPWALMIIFAIWVIVAWTTGYVSLASIAASIALPLASWLTHEGLTLVIITGAMGALAVFKHRSNIQRLLQGTERRMYDEKKEPIS